MVSHHEFDASTAPNLGVLLMIVVEEMASLECPRKHLFDVSWRLLAEPQAVALDGVPCYMHTPAPIACFPARPISHSCTFEQIQVIKVAAFPKL
jgi:hypothetical protein